MGVGEGDSLAFTIIHKKIQYTTQDYVYINSARMFFTVLSFIILDYMRTLWIRCDLQKSHIPSILYIHEHSVFISPGDDFPLCFIHY